MIQRLRPARVLALSALALTLSASAASAAPVSVNLRVEGATQTLFEGPVTTDGRDVTSAKGGTHTCDGSTNLDNPGPGPTATAALDDGARQNGFSWDGPFNDDFKDFFIDRIASDTTDMSHFWALFVDWKSAMSGGCGQQVKQGQEVLWAYADFVVSEALRLEGPTAVRPGQPLTVSVSNGPNGTPQAGASVNGTLTGADGKATLTFATPGIYRLKAERADMLRSNALPVCVDPADADSCTSGDKTAPTVLVKLAGGADGLPGLATAESRSRTLTIAWQAQDPQADGSGVSTYTAEVREIAQGARASQAQDWRALLTRSKNTSVVFRGRTGRAYEFRITAYDRAANASTPATGTLVFPVDDRNRRLLRLSEGDWRGVKQANAYGGRVVRSKRQGASARLRFSGTRVALVGRKLPKGGRLRVTIDAKTATTLKLKGRGAARQTLYTSKALKAGSHTLRLEALDRTPVELDAVAPIP